MPAHLQASSRLVGSGQTELARFRCTLARLGLLAVGGVSVRGLFGMFPSALLRPCHAVPCRQLVAVAQSVCSLATAASCALNSDTIPDWVPAYMEAGCAVLSNCASLAGAEEQLPAASAFKLATASTLVFGPGTVLLQQLMQNGAQQLAQRAATASHPAWVRCLIEVWWWGQGASAQGAPKVAKCTQLVVSELAGVRVCAPSLA